MDEGISGSCLMMKLLITGVQLVKVLVFSFLQFYQDYVVLEGLLEGLLVYSGV